MIADLSETHRRLLLDAGTALGTFLLLVVPLIALGIPAEAAVIDVDPDETPATLGELLAELSARRPRLAAVLDVSSFIVDHRTATRRTPLHAGADVEVLPPFSGG